MQAIQSLIGSTSPNTKSDGLSLNDIRRAVWNGCLTAEQRQHYIDHYMCEEEKEIGKPFFEMNTEEQQRYDALMYNNSVGGLSGYNCKLCKNRGDFKEYRDGYETYVKCECMLIRRVVKAMEKSGLGDLLAEYTFKNYKCESEWQKAIYNKAQAFVSDKNNRWFVMLGESGSGKSMICTAISRELLKQRLNLVFMAWVDDSSELKQSITDGEKYSARIREFKNADVLYIDDLFKTESGTDPTAADIRLAYEILNYRYNKARMDKSKRWATIISSEKSINELLKYDKAIAGRIVEMSSPEYLTVVSGIEKNYRLRNL